MNQYEKFTRKIAKLELGCAPSATYFEELILKARKVIETQEKANHPFAIEVLMYLNEMADRNYKPNARNLNHIVARLNEGYSKEDLKAIVLLKSIQWKDDQTFNKYLNHETLFRSSNIEKYIQEVEAVKRNPQKYKQHVQRTYQTKQEQRNRDFDPLAE